MILLRQAVEASRVSKALEDLEKEFLTEGIRQRKTLLCMTSSRKGHSESTIRLQNSWWGNRTGDWPRLEYVLRNIHVNLLKKKNNTQT